ncbi:MAG TPA: acyltransferase [Chitinophagaceae bacterium]|nr:acyltransferase [Chitinophagaceae bacterium]
MEKLNSIQYLRGFAALMVLYCHVIDFQMEFSTSAQQNFFYVQNFGAIGVDIFFVISGFIISYIASGSGGKTEALDFFKRRFARVNPAYYLASFLYFLVMLLCHNIHGSYKLKHGIIKSITILPIFDRGTEFWNPLLILGWTMSFEWFFYIIYGGLIFYSVRTKSLLLLLILGALTITGWLYHQTEVHYVFVTNPIIWEFCFGVVIARVYKKIKINKAVAFFFLTTGIAWYVCLIIWGYGDISESLYTINATLSWQRVLLWGIPSACIVMGILFVESNYGHRFFSNKILLLLGNSSYAIYLIHPILLSIVYYVFAITDYKMQGLPPDLWIWLLIITVASGCVIYYTYIERLLVKQVNKLLHSSKEK